MLMKRFFKAILVCFLVVVSAFSTGCFYIPGFSGDGGSLLFPSGTVSGYKVCYKPEAYEFGKPFETFSDNLIEKLYSYFTFGNIENIDDVTDDDWNEVLLLDRIRYQPVFIKEDGTEKFSYIGDSWNWSFGKSIENFSSYLNNNENSIEKTSENLIYVISHYKTLKTNITDNIIKSIYSTVLEYNIYEIVLGRTPTAPIVEISDTATTVLDSVKVTLNGIVVTGGDDANRDSIMDEIREEFSRYGTYVGFSDRDKEKLANYILTTVIGDQIVGNTEFNKNNEYQNVVKKFIEESNPTTQLAMQDTTSIRDFFDPYPASKIKDFNSTAFYINGGIGESGESADNAFDHIPSAEYQSFVIMPEQDGIQFSSIWLAFESQIPIDAVLRVRYYNAETGTLFETAKQNITMAGSPFDASKDIIIMDLVYSEISDTELDTSVDMELDIFDNELDDGILKADEIDGKIISGELANYYNIIDSDSGFGAIGVLNHNKIPFSYMEIVIDVVKDPTTPKATYPFKMGIVGIFPTAE